MIGKLCIDHLKPEVNAVKVSPDPCYDFLCFPIQKTAGKAVNQVKSSTRHNITFVSFFLWFLMQDMMVGDEARKHCRKQKMNYPVDNIGIVRNWEDMKHLWDYAFGETKLNVDPKACKVSYKRKILNKY